LALTAGRQQRYEQACDDLYTILPFLHQKVDLLEIYIALAVYEFRRGNTIKARELGKLGEAFLAELALPAPSLPEYREWVEMRLRARWPMRVTIPTLDLVVDFAAGEEVRTEISAKFRRAGIERELAEAGFALDHWWTDHDGRFALSLARAVADPA